MRIEIDLKKSLEQNASDYFNKAKKAKKKIGGAKEALDKAYLRSVKLEKERDQVMIKLADEEEQDAKKRSRKQEWYEKFRWFFTSDGRLAVGGRDATTNDILIKKHMEPNDIVFHTDMAGSPFFLIKDGQGVTEEILQEVAQATASFSRGWRLGLSTLDTFHVNPEQVSKTPRAGEFMGKGSFMIKGKTTYIKPLLKLGVGITKEGRIMAGAVSAIKKNTEKSVVIVPGKVKTSDMAKKIKKKIGGDLDDIVRALPSGGCEFA